MDSSIPRAARRSLGMATVWGSGWSKGTQGMALTGMRPGPGGAWPAPAGDGSGQGLQGRLGRALDVEQLVEPGDLEDLEDLGLDVGQDQLALPLLDLVADVDEHREGGAGHVLDVLEVQQ